MDKKQRAPISHSARWLRRERLVAKYHRSDLSQSDFAMKHGISLSTLQLWLHKSRSAELESGLADSVENAQDRRWIEAGVLEPLKAETHGEVVAEFADGMRLSFSSQIPREQMVQIIQSLRQPCLD